MKTRVKICGISSIDDALHAAIAGADAIGLVFYGRSPRHVDVARARDIVSALPPFVTSVGLFVDAPVGEVEQVLSQVPLDLLQFHGDEPEHYCHGFSRPYLKAVRVRPDTDLRQICENYTSAAGLLVDSYTKGVPGGTGEAFNWDLIPAGMSLPIILAGGLNPGNVADAIARVKPWAVDVSSGVEAAPGRKDRYAVQTFIDAVADANAAEDR